MKVAAVYIRVSTDDQTEHSPDSQLKEAKDYAARHGMIIDADHIYIDAGISGRNAKNRPAFQRMIAAAKGKPAPFQAVLVWKFSRFARNQEESIVYKSLLRRECKVDVISITEETGDSVFGGLIERIIEWMDEFYSIRLSEEVTAKMAYAAEKGLLMIGTPFGWDKQPDRNLTVNPFEAHWYDYARKAVLRGDSILSIARVFRENGVRTKRGNSFDNRAVEYILTNPLQIGKIRWTPGGENSGSGVGDRCFDNPDTIIADCPQVPRLCSDEEFYSVVEELRRRKRIRKKRSKPADMMKHWLSGLVFCSSCGSSLTFSLAHGGFQCWKYAKGQCGVSHYVSAKKLEPAVIAAIEQVTVTEDFVRENTKPAAAVEVVDYAPMISRLEAMLERAKRAYTEGVDTLDEYSANKKRIVAEIDDLRRKDQEQQSQIELPPAEAVQERICSVAALLKNPDASLQAKHDAIAQIVEKITYSKPLDSIEVFFRL